jgi:hypothetical protein
MSQFIKLNNPSGLPNYIRKSSIISIHMINDITACENPYTIWINTSQTCMSERCQDYDQASIRVTEILSLLEE